MRGARRKIAVVLSLAVFASGCFGWAGKRTPEPASTQRLPDPVRITRTDASTIVLRDAAVSGDSIVGYTSGSAETRQRVAVALRDVRTMEAKEVAFLRTAGLSFAVTIVAAAAAVVLVLASWGGE